MKTHHNKYSFALSIQLMETLL